MAARGGVFGEANTMVSSPWYVNCASAWTGAVFPSVRMMRSR